MTALLIHSVVGKKFVSQRRKNNSIATIHSRGPDATLNLHGSPDSATKDRCLVVICAERAGATPQNFGRLKGVKSGVAPAQFGDFFCVTFLFLVSLIASFSRDLCESQGEEDSEDEVEVGNSYLLHLFRPNSHGWAGATHDSVCARNRVQKWGSLQPNAVFCPRPNWPFCRAQLFSFGQLLDRRGERSPSCRVHLPRLQIAIEAH